MTKSKSRIDHVKLSQSKTKVKKNMHTHILIKSKITFIVHPFQIIGHFGFSRFIDITMHLDIHFV